MRRARGLTLLEVIVSAAIMAVLGVVLVRVYDVSRTAYASGTSRLSLQQRARETVQRITPMLVNAIPPSDSEPAVESPEVLAEPTNQVVFWVPTKTFDPRNPTYERVRIAFQPATGIVLTDPDTPGTAGDERVLARNIKALTFYVERQNSVEITVDVQGVARGADNRDKVQDYRLQTVVQIPFYATK